MRDDAGGESEDGEGERQTDDGARRVLQHGQEIWRSFETEDAAITRGTVPISVSHTRARQPETLTPLSLQHAIDSVRAGASS